MSWWRLLKILASLFATLPCINMLGIMQENIPDLMAIFTHDGAWLAR